MLEYAPRERAQVAQAAVRWGIAAPHILRGYIRQLKANAFKVCVAHLLADLCCADHSPLSKKEASHVLLPEELEYLSHWTNLPGGAARAMSLLVSALELDTQREVRSLSSPSPTTLTSLRFLIPCLHRLRFRTK